MSSKVDPESLIEHLTLEEVLTIVRAHEEDVWSHSFDAKEPEAASQTVPTVPAVVRTGA